MIKLVKLDWKLVKFSEITSKIRNHSPMDGFNSCILMYICCAIRIPHCFSLIGNFWGNWIIFTVCVIVDRLLQLTTTTQSQTTARRPGWERNTKHWKPGRKSWKPTISSWNYNYIDSGYYYDRYAVQWKLSWKSTPLAIKIWPLGTGGLWWQVPLPWNAGLFLPKTSGPSRQVVSHYSGLPRQV